jgi:UDP-GlcNAc:undecaprenyl-phosphate GlcNAc-1-phosphate transferase
MLLGFPILDTLIVMTERLMRGASPFKADQNHLHHKLMRLGLYHSEAVFAAYVHQSILIVLALILRYQTDRELLAVFAVYSAMVIAGSTMGDRMGWQLPRYDLVDRVIKGRLRVWRERQVLIRVTFGAVKYLTPALLVLSCLMLKVVPLYFALICLLLACGLAAAGFLQPTQLNSLLRLALYLSIPLIVYQGDLSSYALLPTILRRGYNALFGLLTLLVVLTLKFTRRQKGFRATPMDFLILFVAVVVPYLPDPQLQNLHLGIMATRIVVLIFSYEVLIGELRGKVGGQAAAVGMILAIVAIRAIAS